VPGALKRKIPTTLYQGTGCKFCGGSGYRGQIGIFEILNVEAKMRDLIIRRASIDDLKKAAIAGGMKTMFEDGLEKAEAGVTTIDEVLRVVRE
jgi:type II secretory ATPase GspE/PulE/Tfp pilus assembly ATPase PilB-like protein